MGDVTIRRPNPIVKKKERERQQAVLDAQEMTVGNIEQILDAQEIIADLVARNSDLQSQLLDTQELLAGLLEGGVK